EGAARRLLRVHQAVPRPEEGCREGGGLMRRLPGLPFFGSARDDAVEQGSIGGVEMDDFDTLSLPVSNDGIHQKICKCSVGSKLPAWGLNSTTTAVPRRGGPFARHFM